MKILYECDWNGFRKGYSPLSVELYPKGSLTKEDEGRLRPKKLDPDLIMRMWTMKRGWDKVVETILTRHAEDCDPDKEVLTMELPFPLLEIKGTTAQFLKDPDFSKLPADMQSWIIAEQF